MRMRAVECEQCDAHDYCCKVLENKAMLEIAPPVGKALCDICRGARYTKIMRHPPQEDDFIRCSRCNGTGWVDVDINDSQPEKEEPGESDQNDQYFEHQKRLRHIHDITHMSDNPSSLLYQIGLMCHDLVKTGGDNRGGMNDAREMCREC